MVFLGIRCFGQLSPPDSLEKKLPQLKGKAKVDMLNRLAEQVVTNNTDKTKKYAEEALKLAKEINYQVGIIEANHKIGIYYYYTDDYDQALKFYEISLNNAEKLDNKKLMAQAMSWIGSLYRVQSQHEKALDNLENALILAKGIKDEQRIVYCLRNIGEDYRMQQENEKALQNFQEALTISRKIEDKNQEAYILTAMGEVYRLQSNMSKALSFLNQSVEISLELNNRSLASNNYFSIGEIYLLQSNHAKALDYYDSSLIIAQKLNDNIRMADCFASMADVYRNDQDIDKAMEYYKKSLEKAEKVNYKYTIAYCYSGLGELSKLTLQYDVALEYYNRSLNIANEINDNWRVSDCYSMIGDLHLLKLNYPKAISNLQAALTICKQIDNKTTEASVLASLSKIYFQQNNIPIALNYAQNSWDISQKINIISNKREASELLFKCYEKMGDYKKALEFHIVMKEIADSSKTEETSKKIIQQQMKFEFNQQQAQLKLEQAKKDSEQRDRLNTQRFFTVISAAGLLLAVVIAISFFRGQRKHKLANAKLEAQNQQIEYQKKEITDSINYSKRIQNALLPAETEIKHVLPESFIFYMPKDIVSGDFYYFNHSKRKTKNSETNHFLAVADCTGHGVPGALMSVISYQKLDESVKVLSEPKNILKRLNKKIKTTLKQSAEESSTRDGLDISLLNLVKKDDQTYYIRLSSANRPVYIFSEEGFREIKPTKAAIGGITSINQEFVQHELNLKKGDTIYLFTDGFADQFGGEKQKKFTSSRFKLALTGLQELSMKQQKVELERIFNAWKGENEQVDDILVLGIRL